MPAVATTTDADFVLRALKSINLPVVRVGRYEIINGRRTNSGLLLLLTLTDDYRQKVGFGQLA